MYAPRNCRRCEGNALILSMLLLIVITLLGLSGLSGTIVEERMAGNALFQATAFQAASSEIEGQYAALVANANPLDNTLKTSSTCGTGGSAITNCTLLTAVTGNSGITHPTRRLRYDNDGAAPGYSIGKAVGIFYELDVDSQVTGTGARSSQTQGLMRLAPKSPGT